MANIAVVFKEEIVRLARKELRVENTGLKKASSQHRSDIAALKRRVVELERQVSRLTKSTGKAAAKTPDSTDDAWSRKRFTAKGLRSERQRLGFSALNFAKLIGVSPQSVYNWEAEISRPQKKQIAAIIAVRGIGKREALARIDGANT